MPEKDSNIYSVISQAGNTFQNKFREFIDIEFSISIAPIFIQENNLFNYDVNVRYINNRLKNRNFFSDLYKVFLDSYSSLRQIRKAKSRYIIFYNIDKQNVLIITILLFIYRKKVFIILADYINHGNSLADRFFNLVLNKVSGVIKLNSNIELKNKNQKLLHGLLREKAIKVSNKKIGKRIILSGSLGKTTGFELALKAFSKYPDFELFISGSKFRYTEEEFNKLLEDYVVSSPNIHFLGLMDYKDYISIVDSCDIALSLRNPKDIEHLYNFPSKILEYLSKSKIVVSTIKYDSLPENIYFASEFEDQSLIHTIQGIIDMKDDEIQKLRNEVYEYLTNSYSEKHVKSLVNDMIENTK